MNTLHILLVYLEKVDASEELSGKLSKRLLSRVCFSCAIVFAGGAICCFGLMELTGEEGIFASLGLAICSVVFFILAGIFCNVEMRKFFSGHSS